MREYRLDRDILELWDRYNLAENVRKHCIAVAELAEKIAVASNADVDLVVRGALLHDIGRAVTHDPFLHFVKSGEILRKEGFDDKIVKIAERHFSAGMSKEEAVFFKVPKGNYMPETLEEKIVSLADNLIFGSKPEKFEKFLRRLDEIAINNRNHKWFIERTKERALKMKSEIEAISGLKF
jgi:uncharacterized protein (TIGR00295 family)